MAAARGKLSVAVFQRGEVEMDVKGNRLLNERCWMRRCSYGRADSLLIWLIQFYSSGGI